MNINGTYKTQHGTLIIKHEGDEITATYQENGICKGKISQNKVEGIWENNNSKGLFEWTFEDKGTFTGKYKIGVEVGVMKSKWNGALLESSPIEKPVKETEEPTIKIELPEKEKKISSDSGYLSQLYQKEDFDFLCKCVDVSIDYSANMIEKILDASLKCRNLDIERYSF